MSPLWKLQKHPLTDVVLLHVLCVALVVVIIHMMIFMVLSSWLRAIVRVYPVHLMNADCESAGRLLSFTFTIAILLLLNLKTETCVGWKADRSRHCRKVCSPCQRLYIAVAVMINTIQTCILSHCSWTRWPLDHCDLQDLPICFVNCCFTNMPVDDDDDDDDDGRINFNVAYSPKTARTRNS